MEGKHRNAPRAGRGASEDSRVGNGDNPERSASRVRAEWAHDAKMNAADADVAALDRLLRANIPSGWRHYLRELQVAVYQENADFAPIQRKRIHYLAKCYLQPDGTPRDDTAVNSSWIGLLNAILATSDSTVERHDLMLMRYLIAKRPAQPIPPTWPEQIARHAWRTGVVGGQA